MWLDKCNNTNMLRENIEVYRRDRKRGLCKKNDSFVGYIFLLLN
ncbi:hypothetical protein SAMN05192573_101532 [Mucilaginibacter gossypii]|uniref:Uncharacterized protein n=1 Tax=Mucilaginibacter gossypii TaxID=551996 RepID=A0A1G7PES1_9SPHI|nr:hypothetical protein SAMN05192573_101532 [Mucilaginibacter gossypii]